jgi:acetylornithine deacetylase/succinyl-diaminopimelate desuccinylase-like protein
MPRFVLALTILVCSSLAVVRGADGLDPQQARARAIFKQLIEIDTTAEHGSTTPAAEAMARRLQDAGIPASDIHVVGPTPKNASLVARLRGTGQAKPVLFLAHLDVVEARREDWSVDPFTFLEKDGFFYGRGTADVKDGASILVANLIRLAEAHARPSRDVILALTAGEENFSDAGNGVQWLLDDRRDLIDAEFCVNLDGGDFDFSAGKRVSGSIQAAEKHYMDLTLEVTNKGGHSSQPTADNAIYRLAAGLSRIAAYAFPVRLNEVTRGFFGGRAALEPPDVGRDMSAVTGQTPAEDAVARLSRDPYFNALLRTTCVATMLSGGHAHNALPQRATANVNCRLLPDDRADDVRETIEKVVADPAISVKVAVARQAAPVSPLTPAIVGAVRKATDAVYPGLPIVPMMETGATDGRQLRAAGIPTYGVSGIFLDEDDNRQHGRDERVGVKDFYDGLEFNYQLIKALAF